jgi:hypothetical protein
MKNSFTPIVESGEIRSHSPALDAAVVRNTAFKSMQDMLDAGGNYRPSLYIQGKDKQTQFQIRMIADAYDLAMQKRGDTRRAYRGDFA